MSKRCDPVEVWAPIFTAYFSDAEVVRVTYAISQFSNGAYCKLGDAWIEDLPDEHCEAHAHDLERWREEQRAERAAVRAWALRERHERMRAARVEAGAHKDVPAIDKKQLTSRVRNARWKLAHPERYKREAWTEIERKELEGVIAEATAALERLKTKEAA